MLKWFKKDSLATLEKQYGNLLVEARDLQRTGVIIGCAEKTDEPKEVLMEMDELRAVS